MSTTITVVAVVIAALILSVLMFGCWKGEKVGRRAHLPFRDARRRRKLRAIQNEEEGRYAESWTSTQLGSYPVDATEADNNGQRPSTPPPAYFPRNTNDRPPPPS